jgi:hypothetical protein
MKREAINHTKMRRLARCLNVELWGARGIMESLWHITKEEAPAGDIGKLSDQDIADAIGWTGDAGVLIAGLIESRWLDSTVRYRLVIHDWPDHCEDHVHAKMARAGLCFANGLKPNLNKLPKSDREKYAKTEFVMPPGGLYSLDGTVRSHGEVTIQSPQSHHEATIQPVQSQHDGGMVASQRRTLPIPTIPDPTYPHPTTNVCASEPAASQRFEEFWEQWPRRTGKDSAASAWCSYVTVENEEDVFSCLGRFLDSGDVARGAIPNLGPSPNKPGWLADCARDNWECSWPSAALQERRRPLTPYEEAVENVRRREQQQ